LIKAQVAGIVTALKPNIFGAATLEVTATQAIEPFLAPHGGPKSSVSLRIFLSYEEKDLQRAAEIRTGLTMAGGFEVTYRQPSVQSPRGRSELEAMDGLLVLWSKSSEKSERVASDIDFARQRSLPVTIALVDPVRPPLVSGVEVVELVGWESDRTSSRFQNLVGTLRGDRSRGGTPPAR
jgi:hypothetical protein